MLLVLLISSLISYLWQSVLGKLHRVESISFIGHITDRLATYWHLQKQNRVRRIDAKHP